MKFNFRYYGILLALLVALVSACSVGNKVIPDPGGNSNVDTTNTSLNTFNIIVSGDTSFVMSILSVDSLNSIQDDSLVKALIGLASFANSGIDTSGDLACRCFVQCR